jgi:hypothetical protein
MTDPLIITVFDTGIPEDIPQRVFWCRHCQREQVRAWPHPRAADNLCGDCGRPLSRPVEDEPVPVAAPPLAVVQWKTRLPAFIPPGAMARLNPNLVF